MLRRFEAALERPVLRAARPLALVWPSSAGRVEHLRFEPYYAPLAGEPRRPLIVRFSVNCCYFEGIERAARRAGLLGQGDDYALGSGWRFELSVLPEEAVRFVPFVVGVVLAHDEHDLSCIPEPPVATRFWQEQPLARNYAWSETAWQIATDYDRARSRPRAVPGRREPRPLHEIERMA